MAQKLARHNKTHDLQGHEVLELIQLDERRSAIGHKEVLYGMVIDHILAPHSELIKSKGRYIIKIEIKPTPVWVKFVMIGNGYVMVENKHGRTIAFGIISRALNGSADFVSYLYLDIQRLAQDKKGHWVGGIIDRQGHWQAGTLFGDYLEHDNVIGNEYTRGTKNQIGYETNYFGSEPTKVRVTREGTIQVLANITEEQFINYVMTELEDYFVEVRPR